MLNTINLVQKTSTVQLNAPCTGILQRSHPKSVFLRFAKNSPMENNIFPTNGGKPFLTPYLDAPTKHVTNDDKKYVVILQVLIFGDNQFLVEVVEEQYLV